MFVVLTVFAIFFGTRVRWIQQRRHAVGNVLSADTNSDNYAPWSLRLLGEGGVYQIDVPTGTIAEQAAQLREFSRLFPECKFYGVPRHGYVWSLERDEVNKAEARLVELDEYADMANQ